MLTALYACLQAPKNGMFVCASTLGGPVSPQLKVPGAALSHDIPKFTIDEAALQLCHYTFQVTHLSTDITVLCCTYVVHLAFIVKDIASNVISTGGSSCAAAQCSAAIAQNILRFGNTCVIPSGFISCLYCIHKRLDHLHASLPFPVPKAIPKPYICRYLLLGLLQGVSPHELEWNAIQMAYFQADGIPRELRLWRGRLETLPSAIMLAMQEDESDFDFEPDSPSLEQQSQQALA